MVKAAQAPAAGPAWRTAESILAPRESTICVFPPGPDRYISLPVEYAARFSEATDRTCVVSITFTDAAGKYWRRDEHGKLQKIRRSGSAEPAAASAATLEEAALSIGASLPISQI
jgi:hypothetical protein